MPRPLRVLAVEDSADDVELLVNELSRGGFAPHAEQVETEEAMRAALASSTWDIVFADYRLPRFSVPEALRVLESMGIDLPFIVLSGTIGEETAVEMMRAGAHDYIMKDNMKRLVPAVQHELAEAEVRRERAQAESGLREAETRFRTLAESTLAGVYIIQDGGFPYINPALAEIFGYEVEEIVGRLGPSDLVHPKDRAKVAERIRRRVAGEVQSAHYTFRGLRKDGETIQCEVFGRTVEINGRPAIIGTLLDITERVAAEKALRNSEERYRRLAEELEERVQERTRELEAAQEELVRKERLAVLGELAGSVSHELRNPLGAIKNSVYYLNLVISEPEAKVAKHLSLMTREIERSNRIISDLLEYARPKAPHLTPQEPARVVEQVLSQTETPANVRVTASVPPDLPRVEVDLEQMYHVFGNLIVNAIQAMPEGGEISLGASHRDGHVTFSVRDTGKGISPEDMQRIFEPLFSTKVRGTGLGLSIARIILEGHRGQISAESDGKTGSTFFVKLPVGLERRTPRQNVEEDAQGGEG